MIILLNKFAHNSHAHCDQIKINIEQKIKKCSSKVDKVNLPIGKDKSVDKDTKIWNAQMIGL